MKAVDPTNLHISPIADLNSDHKNGEAVVAGEDGFLRGNKKDTIPTMIPKDGERKEVGEEEEVWRNGSPGVLTEKLNGELKKINDVSTVIPLVNGERNKEVVKKEENQVNGLSDHKVGTKQENVKRDETKVEKMLQQKQPFTDDRSSITSDTSANAISNSVDKHKTINLSENSISDTVPRKNSPSVDNGNCSKDNVNICSNGNSGLLPLNGNKPDEQEMLKVSLESLTESELRMERDSEGRKSKNSMDGFTGSSRSRLDTDTDIEDLLPQNNGDRLHGGYDNLQVDSGVESAASSWDRMAEVKEHAFARLQDELKKAHQKLKLRDEEVTRLSRIREEVEAELEDLTASLFQEAHNMVREANVQQAAAEKALKESQMQIDVLTAEVAALKTLVLTSTPSRPNPHLHPQIDPKTKEDANNCGSGLFRKQHRRSPSHFNLKYGRENSPPDSPSKEQHSPQHSDSVDSTDLLEVDPNLHKEFLTWKQQPSMDKCDPFIARIYREDIDNCLEFNNVQLARQVQEAIENSSICIEAVSDKSRTHFPKKCALLESTRQCHYRMRFDDCDQTYCISQLCRNRITAVCNFLNYLRYIQRGLVKSSVHDMYWEIIKLRKEIALARLGLTVSP